MQFSSLTWRQEFMGYILPALVALIIAGLVYLKAKVEGLTAAVLAANAERAALRKAVDDNHAETLDAVNNGPANAAFRAANSQVVASDFGRRKSDSGKVVYTSGEQVTDMGVTPENGNAGGNGSV